MAMRSKTASTLALLLGLALAACGTNPESGSPAYKAGELGNGGFLFACDNGDGVACLSAESGDAKKFPARIATGATFDVRFVEKNAQGTVVGIDERRYSGVTTEAVAPFIGRGGQGFTALRPGYGTIVARDSAGTIVDFATLTIVRPTRFIVYRDSDSGSRAPAPIELLTLSLGGSALVRVVAADSMGTIAGSIPVAWSRGTDDVVSVEPDEDGSFRLGAGKEGSAILTVDGAGGLSTQFTVVVKP